MRKVRNLLGGVWAVTTLIYIANGEVDRTELARATTVSRIIEKSPAEIAPQSLSEEAREKYIQALRMERSLGEYSIRLRDSLIIAESVHRWLEVRGSSLGLRNTLRNSASPWLILPLSEALLYERLAEQRIHTDGIHGWSDFGLSHSTAAIVRSVLMTAPEIGEATKDWATALQERDPRLLEIMRQWLAINHENLVNERYDLLAPLPDDATRLSSVGAKTERNTSPVHPERTSEKSKSAPPIEPGSPADSDKADGWWPWAVGATLAVVAIAVFAIRRL